MCERKHEPHIPDEEWRDLFNSKCKVQKVELWQVFTVFGDFTDAK